MGIPPEVEASMASAEDPTDPISVLRQAGTFRAIDRLGVGEWTTLYDVEPGVMGGNIVYSGLVTPKHIPKMLKTDDWDMRIGDGQPGFTEYYPKGEPVPKYERFGFYEIEPVVYLLPDPAF